MCAKVLAASKDGLIEYRPLTIDKLQETLELLRVHYFPSERISIAVGLDKNPEGISELNELILRSAEDGVSLIAVEKATGKVVGCLINKINMKKDASINFFEDIGCSHPAAKAYLKVNAELDKKIDYFRLLQTNCYLELMLVSVSPELRNHGVAGKLGSVGIKLYEQLKCGQNAATSLKGESFPLNPVPSALAGICTSSTSKNICLKLGFEEILEVDFRDNTSLTDIVDIRHLRPISVLKFVNKFCRKIL